MTLPTSPYYSDATVQDVIEQGRHREFVGGLWDEIGPLQLALMQSVGLQPAHRLLDVGCGALRAGIRFVEFLEAGNYFGQDLRRELLDAGYDKEIVPADLGDRLPRENLVANDDFDFSAFDATFDFAIAFSLFTHLPLNHIRLCLERISSKLRPGGKFVVSFFERPESVSTRHAIIQPPGIITTHAARDPFHYAVSDLEFAAEGLPFRLSVIGDIGHPRGQRAVVFERRTDPADEKVRNRSIDEAADLPAGADHYRAYVGPPERFDTMSASQFALLFQLGLRDWHSVLDIGCGSLRLGRLAIPFLRAGGYFGIDPNRWLIEEGIAHELGRSVVNLKRPQFDYNENFDCGVFGRKFDFIIAQSIVTHTGPDLVQALFSSAAKHLNENGLFLFSFIDPARNPGGLTATPGWHYPHCVSYSEQDMAGQLSQHGLVSRFIDWPHPGATWRAAAKTTKSLPADFALPSLPVLSR